MTIIKAAELGKKVLDDYNAAMDEQDRIKQGSTVIDVVARHEKEIQELKRLVTPMMEFNQRMPTKIVGPNLVNVLSAAGFYQKKEWVGLTDDEIWQEWSSPKDSAIDFARAIEAKIKEKNT
tara:strand:+ start:98 stop:460 length:363 start_codon:yes stop_codon:yes gene_type:complete